MLTLTKSCWIVCIVFSIHVKLELLTQFPATNDKNFSYFFQPFNRRCRIYSGFHFLLAHYVPVFEHVNPFTTIHDGNFRRHSSMYVTIHDGNFSRIYYSYIRIRGSWYAHQPGSEEVKDKMWHQLAIFDNSLPLYCQIWIIFTHLKLCIASARQL